MKRKVISKHYIKQVRVFFKFFLDIKIQESNADNFLKIRHSISHVRITIITSSNKNYNFLSNYPAVAKEFDPKKFVILLGDSPGDSNMANGMPNLQEIVRIGFLNFNVEEKLEKYTNLFDIVFTNDFPLHSLIKLLKLVNTK